VKGEVLMVMDSNDDSQQIMLTTIDNPYDPFTQYDEWYALDEARGYHSTGLLARYVVSSDELSELDQENAVSDAIQEIIQDNPFGMYVKAYRKNEVLKE
jgi:hypothetical protein